MPIADNDRCSLPYRLNSYIPLIAQTTYIQHTAIYVGRTVDQGFVDFIDAGHNQYPVNALHALFT
jgi:hypothetical protein